MPAEYSIVEAYLKNSLKLKKMKEWYTHDYSKYLPYIVEHKRDTKKLFCRLTKKKLNRIPDEVEKHSKGKKFQRLKKEYDEKIAQRKSRNLSNDVKVEAFDGDEEDESLRYFETLLADEASASDQGSNDGEEEEEEGESDKDSMTDLIGSDHENDEEFILRKFKPSSSKKSAGGNQKNSNRIAGSSNPSAPESSNEIKTGRKKSLRKPLLSKATAKKRRVTAS